MVLGFVGYLGRTTLRIRLLGCAVTIAVAIPLVFAKANFHNDNAESQKYYHFILGTLASLEKDPRAALEHFRSAYHLDPSSTTLLLKQAQELVEMGQIEAAKSLIENIAPLQSENVDFHLLVSRIAAQELDMKRALEAMDQATSLYRDDSNFMKVREMILSKVALLADFKMYEECISTLEAYLKGDPNDEIAHYFLGKVHSIFQNREAAKKSFRRALEIRPDFNAAARSLGLQLELEGNIKEAFKVYQTAVESGSADEELYQKLVNLALIVEDFPTALHYLKLYLALNPSDSASRLRAALIHFKLEQYEEAQKLFVTLKTSQDVAQDRISFYLGAVLVELNEFQKAVVEYKLVGPDSDYFQEAVLETALLLNQRLNKPQEALDVLKAAYNLRNQEPEIVLALAQQFDRMNHIPEGLKLLSKAASEIKDHEKILFMLGVFQDKSGSFDAAVGTMRKVIQINPNNPHALNHIGYSFVDRGTNLSEAETLLTKAAQLAPDNGFIVDSLGWLYFKLGKYSKAAKLLERANQLSPGQVVILEHLADTYKKMGRDREALAVYRQIMEWSKVNSPDTLTSNEQMDAETQAVQDRVRTKIVSLDSTHSN
jgi:tetratricopeptide (TPR) repeat protein